METHPTPSADQLAGLRAATTSNDDRGMLPAALHALIAAIFARIFKRLEQVLLLWQSGNLPALPPPRPAHPNQHHSANTNSACALPTPRHQPRPARSAAPHGSPQDTQRAAQHRAATAMPAPNPAAITSSKPATASPPPHPARAPPPQTPAKIPFAT